MKIARFFLLIIVMTVMTSCMTTAYVQSDDSTYTESSYRLFNPLGYELYYSPSWGYYYYDNYRTRFLFDNFILMYYPDFGMYRYGRYHWDYFGYQRNNCFDRIDRNRNFVQRYESPNYSRQRNSDGNDQRSQSRQVQGSNPMRNQNQGSATRQSTPLNSSGRSYQRSGQVQSNQGQVRTQSVTRRSTMQPSTPARSTYRGSGLRQQSTQRSTPSRSTYQRSPARNTYYGR